MDFAFDSFGLAVLNAQDSVSSVGSSAVNTDCFVGAGEERGASLHVVRIVFFALLPLAVPMLVSALFAGRAALRRRDSRQEKDLFIGVCGVFVCGCLFVVREGGGA